MTNNKSQLFMDLSYLLEEDRLLLKLRKMQSHTRWALTRRMTLAVLTVWIEKLESVDLPQIEIEGLNLNLRDLKQEHALSLEFDAPQISNSSFSSQAATYLVKEVTLQVTGTESTFTLKSEIESEQIQLTRRESHALLEMLALKAQQANWLTSPHLPSWLGAGKQRD
jgi:hypothetical protein